MDTWASWADYELYMGRWSRLAATRFLHWLAVPPDNRWLDVGCGTGVLSEAILQEAQPSAVTGIDGSQGFIERARERAPDARASFGIGDALALPFADDRFDVVVSGLSLNFFSDYETAIAEMVRVSRSKSLVAAYVWDYAGEMQMMRVFWNAVADLYGPTDLDEGRRFPVCQPGPLTELFERAGLCLVKVTALDITTRFRDFDDFWEPFLGGQGPAPSFLATLPENERSALGGLIRSRLSFAPDGSVSLAAKAWAVRGSR